MRIVFFSFTAFIAFIPCVVFAGTYSDKVFVVDIQKDKGIYTADQASLSVVRGTYLFEPSYESFRGVAYNGSAISVSGRTLGYFSIPNMETVSCAETFSEDGIKGGCAPTESGLIRLVAPYFNNAGMIEVYSPQGKKLVTVNVTSKAICNENNVCDRPVEDSLVCSSDCRENQPPIDAFRLTDTTTLSQSGGFSKAISIVVWVMVGVVVIGSLLWAFRKLRAMWYGEEEIE